MAPWQNGDVLIVTGGSSGIGFGIAGAALRRGRRVVINGRNAQRLDEAARALEAPDRVATVPGDVGDPAVATRLADAAVERFGRLDALVNNAGTFDAKPLADYTVEEFDGYVAFLRGAFLVTQAAVERMRSNGGGSIVNITTNLTTRAISDIPSSAPIAGKGGVQALTSNLAIELAPDSIRVNAVAPGIVRTPLIDVPDETLAHLASLHPLGRIGEVDDVGQAVMFLLDAPWITGAILPVDGGLSAGA